MTIPTPVEFWTLNNTLVGAVAANELTTFDGDHYTESGLIAQGWDVAYFVLRQLILSDPVSKGITAVAPWSFSVWRKSADTLNYPGEYLRLYLAGTPSSIALTVSDVKSAFGWTTRVYIDNVQKISKAATKDTNWHHVVVTFAADGTLQVFHDGAKSSVTGVPQPTASYDTMGLSYGATINGIIDSVGWWNVVLSDSEVAELYNAGAGWEYSLPVISVVTNILLGSTPEACSILNSRIVRGPL